MCVCQSSPVTLHIFGVRSGICQYSVAVMVQYSYRIWLYGIGEDTVQERFEVQEKRYTVDTGNVKIQ